jgi:hypothetical protein
MEVKQSLTITKLEVEQSNIKYSIDLPKTGSYCAADNIYIGFSGWIYSLDGKPVSFVFSHMPKTSFIPNRDRPDVQKAFPGAPLQCGAKYPLDYNTDFKIGASHDGKIYWLAQTSIGKAKATALVGKQGHLFLSNDTNDSAGQFLGKNLISKEGIEQWDRYFDILNSWSERNRTPFTFLLAPAKEYIYPEYYPEKKGAITPIEQFTLHFSNKANLLNPVTELTKDREFTYFKTDSHWNDYGASVAASAFCLRAGFVHTPPDAEYVLKQFSGDLGSKFIPMKRENALIVSDHDKFTRHKIFDNGISVRGNIVIYENPEAVNKKSLMIFGDSFSTSLANCLSYSFSKVIRIFSGADIDWNAVNAERPDHVLIELTSRFLIRPPSSGFYVSDEIRRKYASMDAATLDSHVEFLKTQPPSEGNYHVAACRDALKDIAPQLV